MGSGRSLTVRPSSCKCVHFVSASLVLVCRLSSYTKLTQFPCQTSDSTKLVLFSNTESAASMLVNVSDELPPHGFASPPPTVPSPSSPNVHCSSATAFCRRFLLLPSRSTHPHNRLNFPTPYISLLLMTLSFFCTLLDISATSVVPLILSFLILSIFVTPHIPLNVITSATSNLFCALFALYSNMNLTLCIQTDVLI